MASEKKYVYPINIKDWVSGRDQKYWAFAGMDNQPEVSKEMLEHFSGGRPTAYLQIQFLSDDQWYNGCAEFDVATGEFLKFSPQQTWRKYTNWRWGVYSIMTFRDLKRKLVKASRASVKKKKS